MVHCQAVHFWTIFRIKLADQVSDVECLSGKTQYANCKAS